MKDGIARNPANWHWLGAKIGAVFGPSIAIGSSLFLMWNDYPDKGPSLGRSAALWAIVGLIVGIVVGCLLDVAIKLTDMLRETRCENARDL
jgi:hypothetical protein